MADIDKLTGFSSQAFFLKRLEDEVMRVKRYKGNLALLMIEPHYESGESGSYIKTTLNYTLLKQLGALFRRVLRNVDLMGRYEGDTLTILLPETHEEGAKLAAERLLKEIDQHNFAGDEKMPTFHVALDIGISIFFKHAQTTRELISGAQKGLQLAIAEGGSQAKFCPVVLEESSS